MTVEAPAPIRLRTTIFKGCQRCGGTIRLERNADSRLDEDGVDYVCLQCGRHTPLGSVIERLQTRTEGHAA